MQTTIGAVDAASPAGSATARAAALLGLAVRNAANLQAIIDCFAMIGLVAAAALIILLVLGRAPPGPARHVPVLSPGRHT